MIRRVRIYFDCRMTEVLITVGIVSYVALLQALIAEKAWLPTLASLDPLLIAQRYRRGMVAHSKRSECKFGGLYEDQVVVM
jgi:hypothetical protein